MKKLQLMAWPKLCSVLLLVAAALFTASCARDGFDNDKSFESDVQNAQLQSPSWLKHDASPDGESMTLTWEVVKGAGGYQLTVYKGKTEDQIDTEILNTVVDGSMISDVPCAEDTYFKFILKALGNPKAGNKEAIEAYVETWPNFQETYLTIPDGEDLATWFTTEDAEKPKIPGSDEVLYYTLAPNGNYTLNGKVDFGNQKAYIRAMSEDAPATITVGKSTGYFLTGNALSFKNLNFDCSAVTTNDYALTTLSKTPDESLIIPTTENYAIKSPIAIQNCTFKMLPGKLISDQTSASYVIDNFLIKNCIIQFNNIDLGDKVGNCIDFVKTMTINFTVANSTLYNSGAAKNHYFAQISGTEPIKIPGYSEGVIKFTNNTFYNLAYEAPGFINSNTFYGKQDMKFNWVNNIFVDCGNGKIWEKLHNGYDLSNISTRNNTYWYNGSIADEKYDANVLLTDPDLTDPVNGDFTPRGSDQVTNKTGDPRWL